MSLVTIFTNCVSLYSGTYLGSLYSYPFLFKRQYMQNQSDRKKTKQLYNKMHPRKRYGNNFYNFTNRVTAITFNFSLRHFPCYFKFTCRSYFAVSLTDSVSETMFFSSTNCLYGTLSDTSTYTDAVKIFTTEWLSFVRLLYKL